MSRFHIMGSHNRHSMHVKLENFIRTSRAKFELLQFLKASPIAFGQSGQNVWGCTQLHGITSSITWRVRYLSHRDVSTSECKLQTRQITPSTGIHRARNCPQGDHPEVNYIQCTLIESNRTSKWGKENKTQIWCHTTSMVSDQDWWT
jgi:hypothetical protein